jgi:hypothetical protein
MVRSFGKLRTGSAHHDIAQDDNFFDRLSMTILTVTACEAHGRRNYLIIEQVVCVKIASPAFGGIAMTI